MAISTQTLASAANLVENNVLVDLVDVFILGEPRTEGFEVIRDEVPFQRDEPALVQTTTLANAVESRVTDTYSIKVRAKFPLEAGMMVEVTRCAAEPLLEGTKLLVDKVSLNGAAVLRKAVASSYHVVDQQGKEAF